MAPDMPPARLIGLETSWNFRDLGGYVGAGGRPVRWRTLFRSDGLYRLSEADRTALAGLGLRTVIDLRTPAEIVERGQIDWPDERFHHFPLMDVLPPTDDYGDTWVDSERVAAQYLAILAGGTPAIVGALDVLCDPAAYPAVYHCMVGKDRTGILSAILLSALGVDRADVVADYALSGDAMVRMMDWIAAEQPELAQALAQARDAIEAAPPVTMERFLEALDEKYGGVEPYLESIDRPDTAVQLRALLLEP